MCISIFESFTSCSISGMVILVCDLLHYIQPWVCYSLLQSFTSCFICNVVVGYACSDIHMSHFIYYTITTIHQLFYQYQESSDFVQLSAFNLLCPVLSFIS